MEESKPTQGRCAAVTMAVRVALTEVESGRAVHGWATKLCEHGIRVDTPGAFPPGTPVEVRAMAREGDKAVRLQTLGTVLMADPDGTGVEFTNPSDNLHEAVRRLIRYFPSLA
ncbi:MAG: PilZ domain-containing protein [Nitrospirae bacterium]|nr:PilZ domain-containing protein [Nitrospirota bacterium]